MNIALIFAGTPQINLNCRVEDDARVGDVIEKSGILKMCRDIDLSKDKVGIYGRFVKLDSELKEGDRIEIYRKITRVLDDDEDDDDD